MNETLTSMLGSEETQQLLEELNVPSVTTFHLTIATALALGADPLCRLLWNAEFVRGLWSAGHERQEGGFTSTVLYGAVHSITISARVYLGLVLAELILEIIPVMHAALPRLLPEAEQWNLQQAAPSVAFSLWVGLTACTVKKILLLQSTKKKLGRVGLFDKFFDFIIMFVTILNIMDILNIDLSYGMQSLLSAGGITALAFSLASQDLAQGLVGGIAVQAWDAFQVGDIIILGDGTEGIVKEIGLIETHLKGYDSIVTRIPNSQLTTARVSNLSRVRRSRLVQNLRFKYQDIDKLPSVLEEIKTQIRELCPKVITDGSAGFYAVMEEYCADHIGAQVIANFEIPPRTPEFIHNRQEFMLAIAKAIKKHNIQFAIPSVEYQNRSPMMATA